MRKIYLMISLGMMFVYALPAAAQSYYGNDGWNMMGWSGGFGGMMGYGMMFFGWIFWILILVGLVYLIKWLVGQGRGDKMDGGRAEEILKERYAKGEIDKKEFEEKMKEIKNM